MNLPLVDPQLMRQLRLLGHQILNLPHSSPIQQTILIPHRQTQRFRHALEIRRHRNQRRVTRHRRINLSMRSQYRISSSPAESQRAHLSRPGHTADMRNKGGNQRFCDALAMSDEPRR